MPPEACEAVLASRRQSRCEPRGRNRRGSAADGKAVEITSRTSPATPSRRVFTRALRCHISSPGSVSVSTVRLSFQTNDLNICFSDANSKQSKASRQHRDINCRSISQTLLHHVGPSRLQISRRCAPTLSIFYLRMPTMQTKRTPFPNSETATSIRFRSYRWTTTSRKST